MRRAGKWVTALGLVFAMCASAQADLRQLSTVKNTRSGREIQVSDHWVVSDACTTYAIAKVRIVRSPKHGKVSIRPGKVRPNVRKGDPRHRCNSRQINGLKVFYRPDRGFKGRDTIKIIGGYGLYYDELTVTVNVR